MTGRLRGIPAGALWLSLLVGLQGCLWNGPAVPHRCSIEIVGVAEFRSGPGFFDAGYQVRGEASSVAKVWLAAKAGSGKFLSGNGVSVGPGPFDTRIDLDLTGRPLEYIAVLEVAGHRCSSDTSPPGS